MEEKDDGDKLFQKQEQEEGFVGKDGVRGALEGRKELDLDGKGKN